MTVETSTRHYRRFGVEKANQVRISGLFLIALAIILRQFVDNDLSNFFQGFCIGLGLCLLTASFIWAQGRVEQKA